MGDVLARNVGVALLITILTFGVVACGGASTGGGGQSGSAGTGQTGGSAGGGGAGGGQAGDQLTTLVVGASLYDSAVLMAPLHIAQVKGFMAEEGLEIEVIATESGGETMRTVTTGGADLAIGSPSAAIAAVVKGQPVKVVAPWWQYAGIYWVARADSPYHDIHDLEGAELTHSGAGSTGEFLAKEIIQISGVKNVGLVNTGGSGATIAAAEAGEAATAWTVEPVVSELVLSGNWRIVVNSADFIPDFMLDAIVASDDIRANNPEAIRSFIRAIEKAHAFISNNQEEAAEIMGGRIGFDPAIILEGIKREASGLTLKVNPKAFATVEKGMLDSGALDEPVENWDDVLIQDYLPEELRADMSMN